MRSPSLLLVVLAHVACAHEDVFRPGIRKAGHYIDNIQIESISRMPVDEYTVVLKTHMQMENKVNIEDLPNHHKVIDMELTHIDFFLETPEGKITCNSGSVPVLCSDFDSFIGTKHHVELDANGEVVSADEPSVDLGTILKPIAPSTQVSHHSRHLHFLPSHKDPQPGDTWDASVTDEMGSFDGIAELTEIKEYQGHTVLVIEVSGDLQVHLDHMQIDQDVIEFKDGTLKTTLYWDEAYSMSRYSKIIEEFTAVIEGPMEDEVEEEDEEEAMELFELPIKNEIEIKTREA